jgi:hypothetical protein
MDRYRAVQGLLPVIKDTYGSYLRYEPTQKVQALSTSYACAYCAARPSVAPQQFNITYEGPDAVKMIAYCSDGPTTNTLQYLPGFI